MTKLDDISKRNTTLTGCVFNMTKSAVGTGTLVLAYNMRQMGLALGLSLLTVAAIFTAITLHFLARISSNMGCSSYFALGKMSFGVAGEISAIFALVLFLIGALIFYAMIVGVYLSRSLIYLLNLDPTAFYTNQTFLVVLAGALLIFPLACLKDMSKLAKVSIAGMACMVYVAVLTIFDYFYDSPTSKLAKIAYARPSFDVFTGFSNFLFAYTNHFTIVGLMPVMIDPTPSLRTQLILFSSGASTLMYISVAAFGYLHFGDAVTNNILLSPKTMTMPYAIAQLLVGLVVVFSFPLLAGPTRGSIDRLLEMAFSSSPAFFERISMIRHFGLTALITSFCVFIAATIPDLALNILGLFSALCGSLLLFIFPSLYFLKLQKHYRTMTIERSLAYVEIVLGLIVMVMGTYTGIMDMIAYFQLN